MAWLGDSPKSKEAESSIHDQRFLIMSSPWVQRLPTFLNCSVRRHCPPLARQPSAWRRPYQDIAHVPQDVRPIRAFAGPEGNNWCISGFSGISRDSTTTTVSHSTKSHKISWPFSQPCYLSPASNASSPALHSSVPMRETTSPTYLRAGRESESATPNACHAPVNTEATFAAGDS